MLAKRLDALQCGPKKPLQGRIRRAPASPLPRARINRWIASKNVRRYDWTASSGSVVANDPVNGTDPTGMCEGENCPINYFHPELDRQVEGVKQEIGRQALTGMAIGASLILGPETLVARGGAYLAGRLASSSFTRAISVAERIAGGLERTGGSRGQRTLQGFLNGGRAAAQRLFNGLTRGESVARDGGRLGALRDGSTVQMSTRTLRDGAIRTDVRISREVTPTGSRIPRTENIKLRFDEKPQ